MSFAVIFIGFFSCGYQLAFVTAHLPPFMARICGPIMPGEVLHSRGITTSSALGVVAISIIGLGNIAGPLAAGWAGKRYAKGYLLARICTGRTVAAEWKNPDTDDARGSGVFFAVIGSLWLATVPLDLGARGAPVRAALHGHAQRDCAPEPPTGRLFRRLARRNAL